MSVVSSHTRKGMGLDARISLGIPVFIHGTIDVRIPSVITNVGYGAHKACTFRECIGFVVVWRQCRSDTWSFDPVK